MANPNGLQDYDFDPQNSHFHYGPRLTWPMQNPESSSTPASAAMIIKRSTSPLPLAIEDQSYHQTATYPPAATILPGDWVPQAAAPVPFQLDTASFAQHAFDEAYGQSFHTSPTDYLPQQSGLEPGMDASLNAGISLDGSYVTLSSNLGGMNEMGDMNQAGMSGLGDINQMPISWAEDVGMGYTYGNLQEMIVRQQQQQQQQPPVTAMSSPGETHLSDNHEVQSLSSSDNGWALIEPIHAHAGTIFNPPQSLHPRTFSDSSCSDTEQHSHNLFDGYVEVSNSVSSPSTNSTSEMNFQSDHEPYYEFERQSPPVAPTTALVKPSNVQQASAASSPQRSPTYPNARRPSRKTPIMKSGSASSKTSVRRPSQIGKTETEKKVGRRKGPLRPDQRKQASEIRKLGACIRCRFLKKTCDKGDPCGGCQPSHARLWLVPCTRIDIKDLGYFLKDWRADYERHVSLGFSVGNIKGFSDKEKTLFITHGYGHYLPIQAREVYVRDERVFGVNWTEAKAGKPSEHEVDTAKLSAGMEGISTAMLSDYLDRHIDGGFEYFVDEHFEGTPFITEILKTAYRFWTREKTAVIRKALKLVLAYNLTQAVCLVRVVGSEEDTFEGKIEDEDSYYNGQTAAPVMINFQVKCAMADMWRELQKDILEELSALYSSIYSRDKLKNWPTIFILASILLTIWEEMQFDCRYRVPDTVVVEKFCNDMESTPVGVIVGLFSAISQKVPAFTEWETRKHHMLLNSNQAVCLAMEEVRDNVTRHETYLKNRSQAKFDRHDFDCLSNKFVSKLVIRAH